MPDHRHHGRVGVQLLGDPHGRFLLPRVVGNPQLERPASHAPLGVDLRDRQLGGLQHGHTPLLGEGPCQTDHDGTARTGARRQHQGAADES